jgi:transcription antitermination factor NusG
MRRYTNGIITPARPARLAPLFPRYVFCRFSRADPSWKRIWGMIGVDALLGLAEAPIAVPDAAIELVRSMCSENGCIYPSTHAGPLPVGTSVRLLNGPLADLAGIVEMSDGRRVRLLLQLLGQPVPVKVRQAAVEVVAA